MTNYCDRWPRRMPVCCADGLRKNGWTDRRPVCGGDSWEPKKHCIRWGPHPRCTWNGVRCGLCRITLATHCRCWSLYFLWLQWIIVHTVMLVACYPLSDVFPIQQLTAMSVVQHRKLFLTKEYIYVGTCCEQVLFLAASVYLCLSVRRKLRKLLIRNRCNLVRMCPVIASRTFYHCSTATPWHTDICVVIST